MTTEFTGTTNINYYDPTISYQDLSSVDLSTSTAVYTNLGTGQPSNGYVSNMTARTPTPHVRLFECGRGGGRRGHGA